MCTNTEEILSKSSNSVLLLQIGLFLPTGIPYKESLSAAFDHYMKTLGTLWHNKQWLPKH